MLIQNSEVIARIAELDQGIQLAVAGQACLPALEAEAKVRQVLALAAGNKTKHGESSINSVLNESSEATERAELNKKIPQSTQQAAKIMGVGAT
ncbi:MAG: hypothetical protein Q8Q50_09225 [Methylobacter sp.]|nr:hypothetical protein [Methylobacter sp.]